MNQGQQKFHDFLMAMVAPGNEQAAETILTESFDRQDAGRLPPDAVDQTVAQLTPLLKPGGATELKKVAAFMKETAAHASDGHSSEETRAGDPQVNTIVRADAGAPDASELEQPMSSGGVTAW